MTNFICIIFPGDRPAFEALRVLDAMHATGMITLFSHAVVQREDDGVLTMKERRTDDPVATGIGALVGGLVGMFAGPVGIAVGLTAGTVLGASRDLFSLGVSDEFLHTITRELAPGKTALVAEIAEDWKEPLDERMRALGGVLVREARDDFIDDEVKKRIARGKTELLQRRAEFIAARAGKQVEAIEKQAASAEARLREAVEDARFDVARYREEMDAKLAALQKQLPDATAQARARIEERMAAIRAEQARRLEKIDAAMRVAQDALHG